MCDTLHRELKEIPQMIYHQNPSLIGTELEKGPHASTPAETEVKTDKLPKKVTLKELLHQPGGLKVPATDIIAAPEL